MESDLMFRDPELVPIWEKTLRRERLSEADGLTCLGTYDVLGLGRIADEVARRSGGRHQSRLLTANR